MIHKTSLAVLSTSALATGLAHGAVLYTYSNQTIVAGGNEQLGIDLNQDGTNDFLVEFNNNNPLKPYITDSVVSGNPPDGYVLSDATDPGGFSMGLPLTTNGTVIDVNYETPASTGYFYDDNNNNTVGGWNSGGVTLDGYVGLAFIDSENNTHYGWAQFSYNSTNVLNGVTGTITLVDYAMETQTSTSILAGQTAEVGPPSVYLPPASETNNAGGTAQFKVIATGFPFPSYQWMAGATGSGVYTNLSDAGNISGSAAEFLTISNVTPANAGDYVVKLVNTNGSATSIPPATLTIAPLVITGLSPSPIALYTGGKASISVSYDSSVPITSFKWRQNGVPLSDGGNISGSTSQNLVISALTAANAGNYSVVLSNSYGAVTSVVDSLTVLAPMAAYEQEMISLGPVAYYGFDETSDPATSNALAFDYVGGHNGIYGYQVQNGNTNYNIAGPRVTDGFAGFPSNNAAMSVGPTAHSPSSWVNVPALNLDTNTVTYLAWVNPQTTEGDYDVLISYRSPVAGTANGLNYGPSADLSYHWNDQGYSYNYDSGLIPPVDQWSLVALTISPSNAVFYLFNTNGTSMATNVNANIVQPFNTPGTFGGDSVDGNFTGYMDEVAIFNQTLSADQLTQLYNVAVTGALPPPTTPPTLIVQPSGGNLVVTWSAGILLQAPSLTGPWTTNSSSSPYTVVPTGGQMFYRAKLP